ncbi:MAG: SDR family oxidoreductase [Anaerolineales bacterium]|nr:SDR family oxidoreductase [Anaerolineales bacterium]
MNSQPSLLNQVIIITGGGTGFGAAIARVLAAEGAQCVLAGRRREPLEAVAAEIGPAAHIIPTDVLDVAQLQHLITETIRRFGRLDILVNNAGIYEPLPFAEITPENWEATLNTNLRSVFQLTQLAWPHLIQSCGQVVNISSTAGLQGFEGCAAYSASKFGLNGLTEVLAIEGKPHGIRAFSVCPAAADTPMWQTRTTPNILEKMLKPESIAETVRWLVTASRLIHIAPVVIRNFQDPWG